MDAVIDAGLGRFLGFVSVKPWFDGDEFLGWQIVSLSPGETWQEVDLRPGDVVTRINGKTLEREGDAHAAFVSLKQAATLTVTYLRGEEERELVWRIVPRPGRQPASSPGGAASVRPK